MIGHAFKLLAVIAGLAAGGALAATRGLTQTAPAPAQSTAPPARIAGVRLTLIFKIAIALGFLAALGGLLVSASGIIPIKASDGHWPFTHWLLDFSKRRSVATNSLGLTVPLLNDDALVLRGAGHFETGCAPCHGSPALKTPRIAWRMTPNPPELVERSQTYDDAELFYIVKHGIKFTGMPAWPSPHRDDEVWAMTAFLRRLPQLDAAAYRALALGAGAANAAVVPLSGLTPPPTVPRAVSESCARCHGYDGQGRGAGAFPKLNGQRVEYLFASLQAYQRHQRHSGLMEPIAAGLDEAALRELADFYARLPQSEPASNPDAAAVTRGEEIARHGLPSQRVAACIACHGPDDTTPRHPAKSALYPTLTGQHAAYLTLQLQLFKEGRRGGTSYAHVMRQAASGLTPEQMRDVAAYYSWRRL